MDNIKKFCMEIFFYFNWADYRSLVLQAIEQLLQVEESRKENCFCENTLCVGMARLGAEDQKIVAAPMKDLMHIDFGGPLHSLVIVGETHPIENEVLDLYKLH